MFRAVSLGHVKNIPFLSLSKKVAFFRHHLARTFATPAAQTPFHFQDIFENAHRDPTPYRKLEHLSKYVKLLLF